MLELDVDTTDVLVAHRRLKLANWKLISSKTPLGAPKDILASYERNGSIGWLIRDAEMPRHLVLLILGETTEGTDGKRV